jgi:hypothetical protein
MPRLIPIRDLPYSARAEESAERRQYRKRADALDEARYEIVLAPGCHGEPEPPTVGWVLTAKAAEALASRVTYMPGGTCHRRLRAITHGFE